MKVSVFLELVEIKAKTASVFPFAMGICYSVYHYQRINRFPLFLYFIAMILFNMFVDMWDNYHDYHRAVDTQEYKRHTNVIGREQIPLKTVRIWLSLLLISSLILGLIVAKMCGFQVLVLGMVCYGAGIFYSGGPKPLSALPVGEALSGVTMGFLIFLICVFINATTAFKWHFLYVGNVGLTSLPSVLLISNLMLANNTCDKEEDERNHRFTIVHYIGVKWALIWWCLANVLSFVFVLVAVLLHLVPVSLVAIFLYAPFMYQGAKKYLKEQVKTTTFRVSVNNLAVFSALQVLLFLIGLFM